MAAERRLPEREMSQPPIASFTDQGGAAPAHPETKRHGPVHSRAVPVLRRSGAEPEETK